MAQRNQADQTQAGHRLTINPMVQPRKPAVRLVKAPMPDYVLRVELKYIKPAIWRRIIVPGSIRLGKLHVVLQLVMGWEGERIADHPINRIDELLPWHLMPTAHIEQQAA